MKTTLNLDEALLRAAKTRAAEHGITLTSLIEDAIRVALEPSKADYRFEFPTINGDALPFDINDRGAMYDWFDPIENWQ